MKRGVPKSHRGSVSEESWKVFLNVQKKEQVRRRRKNFTNSVNFTKFNINK